MRTGVLILSLSLLAGGCISKKKYDELAQALADEKAAHQSDVADRDATIATQKTKIQSLEQAIEANEAELAALNQRAASLEANLKRLTDEKAALLKDKTRLRGSLEEMQRALAELEERRAQTEARLAEYRHLLDKFKALIDAGKLKIKIVDGRMLVEMATDILFASGSASLSKDGKTALAEVAEVLATLDKRWQVAGHTDDDPIHTDRFPSNWELAAARAIGVTKAMVEGGVPADRISAASYAAFQPIAANDSKEGKAANRRIEIVMVPDLSQMPGYDELQQLASE